MDDDDQYLCSCPDDGCLRAFMPFVFVYSALRRARAIIDPLMMARGAKDLKSFPCRAQQRITPTPSATAARARARRSFFNRGYDERCCFAYYWCRPREATICMQRARAQRARERVLFIIRCHEKAFSRFSSPHCFFQAFSSPSPHHCFSPVSQPASASLSPFYRRTRQRAITPLISRAIIRGASAMPFVSPALFLILHCSCSYMAKIASDTYAAMPLFFFSLFSPCA